MDQRAWSSERLEAVEAMLAAMQNRDAVMEAVEAASDQREAMRAVQGLLGVTEDAAEHVLRLRLSQFTAFEKQQSVRERDDLRAWLAQNPDG